MRAFALLGAGLLLISSTALADSKKDWGVCAGTDDDQAIAACTRIITHGKETRANIAIAYGNRGGAYHRKDDQDKALADLNEAISHDAKSAFSYYNRGLVYEAKGDNDRALTDLDTYLGLKTDDPDGFKARGDIHYAKQDYDQAIADYDDAIRLKPDFAEAYAQRGYAYDGKQDYDRTLADCSKAIELKPDLAEGYGCRGDAYAGKDNYDKSITDYDKAVEIAGDAAWSTLYRARANDFANIGEFDKAMADYDRSVKLDADDIDTITNRGEAFCVKGDYDRALADLGQALKRQPDDADTLRWHAWCVGLSGDLDKALPEAERAVSLAPESSDALYTRGWIYMQKNMLDLATADFDKAISLDPTGIELIRDRGLLFEKKGDRDKALAEYRKALVLKPKWYLERLAQETSLERLTALAGTSTQTALSSEIGVAAPNGLAPPPAEKRIALVIGNSAYTNVQSLKNADSDASAVATALRGLGFDVIEKHDLTLAELIATLKSFGDRAEGYDWALVYYAGHGIEIGGTNYLIPVDAELSTSAHVDDEALPLDRVLAKVEGAHKLRLVILDACRENPFLAKMASASGTRSIGRGLARIEPDGGVLVAYSAKDGQVAQDGDGTNSPFAQALLEHLSEPGLEINMLFRKVRDDVEKRTNGEQIPFTYGSLPAEALYFKATGP